MPGAAAADPVLVPDATTVTEAVAGDGVVAAGDDAFIVEGLRNVGGVAVTGVSATLTTSTPGVIVTQPTSAYPDSPPAPRRPPRRPSGSLWPTACPAGRPSTSA